MRDLMSSSCTGLAPGGMAAAIHAYLVDEAWRLWDSTHKSACNGGLPNDSCRRISGDLSNAGMRSSYDTLYVLGDRYLILDGILVRV